MQMACSYLMPPAIVLSSFSEALESCGSDEIESYVSTQKEGAIPLNCAFRTSYDF